MPNWLIGEVDPEEYEEIMQLMAQESQKEQNNMEYLEGEEPTEGRYWS